MIGIGWIENNNWKYKCLLSKDLSLILKLN